MRKIIRLHFSEVDWTPTLFILYVWIQGCVTYVMVYSEYIHLFSKNHIKLKQEMRKIIRLHFSEVYWTPTLFILYVWIQGCVTYVMVYSEYIKLPIQEKVGVQFKVFEYSKQLLFNFSIIFRK